MAGQAKVLATYDRPFWRDAGLSGDAMSRRGPMVEVHDASPQTEENSDGPFGIFGFVGVPANVRAGQSDAMIEAAVAQLGRLFGEAATKPRAVYYTDWAGEAATATPEDMNGPTSHPRYGLPQSMRGLMDGRLNFGGTEVEHEFGGYLEGALEAAEAAVAEILSQG